MFMTIKKKKKVLTYLFSLIRNKLENVSIAFKLKGTYMRCTWIIRDGTNSFIMRMKSKTWPQFGI